MIRPDDARETATARVAGAPDHVEARRLMVASQLRPSGVDDPRVAATMALVPREKFVPADRVSVAYSDRPIPLGEGREMNAPVVTARLLNQLRVAGGERVLLIGAAHGYAAALLATLGATVTAVEEDPRLAAAARIALAAGHDAVTLIEARLATGHADGGPYDIIFIDGSVERVPNTLIAQLVDGGRLVAVLREGAVGRLVIGRKSGAGFGTDAFADGEGVRLPGFGHAPTFRF